MPSGQVAAGPRRPRKIVVVKPCCIGDVLLASPLAQALSGAWPDAELHWAADRHSAPAAAGIPGVGQVIDATGCAPRSYRAWQLARLVRELRRSAYDAAFVPDRSRVLAWVVAAAGIPRRVGLDSAGRGRAYTVRVPVPTGVVRHEAQLYLELARACGLAVPEHPRLTFVPSAGDVRRVRRLVAQIPIRHDADGPLTDRPMVALHPGGGTNPGQTLVEKRWPAAHYARVARHLITACRAHVVVLGGAGDGNAVAAMVGALAAALPADLLDDGFTDLSGQTSLGETAALIAACRLFIGNDSGIAHLAMAVGCPAVVVFGPTDPARYGPLPGAGVAVTPDGRAAAPISDLATAAGSHAVEYVAVGDVIRAAQELLSTSA